MSRDIYCPDDILYGKSLRKLTRNKGMCIEQGGYNIRLMYVKRLLSAEIIDIYGNRYTTEFCTPIKKSYIRNVLFDCIEDMKEECGLKNC